jgi:hypothetical protein
MPLAFSDAFKSYGAKLVNPQWACSAIANDGSLVISCWSHKLSFDDGVLTYTDRVSRWKTDSPGRKLLIEHLKMARDKDLLVRLVVATTTKPEKVDRGDDASAIPKKFHVKKEAVGKVVLFDDDNYVIKFRHI